jgi:hypothetical protein
MPAPTTTRRANPSDHHAGKVLEVIADGLTAHGFDVRTPTIWEQWSLMHLINVRGALCEVTLAGDDTITWEYRPFHGTNPTPDQLTNMAMVILGSVRPNDQDRSTKPCPGLTLKGIVGRALAERGLSVRLKTIYEDHIGYEIYAVIDATNPAQPTRGHVQVGDDSSLHWEVLTSTNGLAPGDIAQIIASALSGCST